MATDMFKDLDLEKDMGGIEDTRELLKFHIRYCAKKCGAAYALQEQHEQRLVSVEKKLTAAIENQSGAANLGTIIPRIPKWSYPIVFISAVFAGLAMPVVIVIYLVLVSKGVMPKIW